MLSPAFFVATVRGLAPINHSWRLANSPLSLGRPERNRVQSVGEDLFYWSPANFSGVTLLQIFGA
jgi:hypothetical protein